MENHADIIRELGGYAEVARIAGVSDGTASAWQSRKSLPVEHWPALVEAARGQGKDHITFEALTRLAPTRARRAQEPAA